jgi:hypothetical protein
MKHQYRQISIAHSVILLLCISSVVLGRWPVDTTFVEEVMLETVTVYIDFERLA